MTENTIGDLLDRVRRGVPGAFEALVQPYRGRLEAVIRARLGRYLQQKVDAEDVLQEVLLRAFKGLSRFRNEREDSFFVWLSGIATYVICEIARREKRQLITLEDATAASEEPPPSTTLRRNERFDRLDAALARLSPEHRQVILLARIDRLPLKDVAHRMGRTPRAASQLLLRALRKLKESFGSTDSLHLPHGPGSIR